MTSLPRVLISNIMMLEEKPRFNAELRERGYQPVWADVTQFMDENQCLSLVGDVDGWLAGDDMITRRVIEAALPRLKVISKWGTGIDSIDQSSAADLGVQLFNSPAAFADAVAEVAIGLILMTTRHLGAIDRAIRAGGWPKLRGKELRGATLGLIGYGAIGQRIGELGIAFGMNVIFHDPIKEGSQDLLRVATEADILCLACALTSENAHIVNKKFLSLMKTSAILVNVARGPLIDELALVEALHSGSIVGAALDVFDIEPLPCDSPLIRMDNVVLSSHNANNAVNAVEAVHANTLQNLDKGLGRCRFLERAN